MHYRLLASLCIAAAVLGCGETSRNPATDAAPEPGDATTAPVPWDESRVAGCDLVTNDEIRLAIGEPVVEAEEGGIYGCRWTTESAVVGLRVFPDPDLPPGSCEGESAMPYGQSAEGKLEPVAGVGETAVWGSRGNLLVCTGSGLLVVDLEKTGSAMAPEQRKQAAVRIANNALGRLSSDVRSPAG